MHTLKQYLSLLCCCLLVFSAQAQTTNDDLQQVLQRLDRGESAEHMLINLSDINFATGTATLEAGARTYLDQVAKLLRSVPNMSLLIKGHADNTGSATVNQRLSEERAKAVRNYLSAQNISFERLSDQGFGSSLPVADNQTAEGRAQNRRVEMEILKKETAKTLQDIIVLRNGERIGALVRMFDQNRVVYRQFSDMTEQQIAVAKVERIRYADGREVVFTVTETPKPEKTTSANKSTFKFNPFAQSEAFHPGQFVLGLGLGVENNIGIKMRTNKLKVPPVWMVMELPLRHNIGVGLSAGVMMWSPKGSDGNEAFAYYSIAPRIAYHFNLGRKVDLYAGLAVAGRMVTLEVDRQPAPLSVSNRKVDAMLFGGMRYYFNPTFGIYGEYGSDNVACARLGIAMRFGQ